MLIPKTYKRIARIALTVAALLCANQALANYQLSRYPLDEIAKVTANYGQYRNYDPNYRVHDGIDLAGGINGKPVFPVAEGIIERIELTKPKEGFGIFIVVRHDKAITVYQTMYAHLQEERINNPETGYPYKKDDRVYPNNPIGYVGNTGNSKGPHLHFNIGVQALGGGQENPIAAGLPQPYSTVNTSRIVGNKAAIYQSNEYVRIIGPDKYGVLHEEGSAGNNEEVNMPEPNVAYKIVAEAYQNAGDRRYPTNPYGIEFIVEKLWPSDPSENKHEIKRFNKTFSEMNSKYRDYYSFVKPCVTYPDSVKDFYYLDWTPRSYGIYNIKIKVYSAYREGGQLRFQDPPYVQERLVTVGWAGVDYNEGAYAGFNPNEPRVAATGVRSAAVALSVDYPTIYYNDLSSNIFSMSHGDRNFPNSTAISARADRNVEWTVRIFNSSNAEVATLTDTGERLRKRWGGSYDGEYTYLVEARDPVTDKTTTDYGVAVIRVDTRQPDISIESDSTVYITTSEAKAVLKYSSDEDLYTTKVSVVDVTGGMVIDCLAASPNLGENEGLELEWETPGQLPNGWYNFKITATDLAGNQTVKYIPVQVNLPGQPAPSDNAPDPTVVRLTPPEEVKNLVVGDIAFDNNRNMYVLYTNKLKVIKYDSAGKEIGKIDSFTKNGSTESLWYPLGLAVSPSGDRVYVADTYANRVLIYDGDLRPVKEIKGQDVFVTYGDIDTYEWLAGIKLWSYSDAAGGGLKKHLGEKYNLPEDIILSGNNLYVVDKDKHRILKYDRDGGASIFSVLNADLKSEARAAFNRTDYVLGIPVSGRTVDRALIYSSALNNLAIFFPAAIDRSGYNRGWTSQMFYCVSPAGTGDAQFSAPESVATDSTGFIYIADADNDRIQKFAPDGSFESKFGEGKLSSPKGIDVDAYGNTWVADTGNRRIAQFDPAGTFVNEYQSDGYNIDPQKIVVRGGKIYIADANSSRPLVWNVAGEISNVRVSNNGWFSPNSDGNEDNLDVSYNLSQPADITIQAVPTSAGASVMSTGMTALNDQPRSIGLNKETWTGEVISGEGGAGVSEGDRAAVIADGIYSLNIIAAFGDYLRTVSTDINVDTRPPSLSFDRAPPAISPNGDSVNDCLQIDYSVSDNLSPTSEVKISLLKNGRVLDVILDENDWSTGRQEDWKTLDWNGKIGDHVMEGNYVLELKATDLAGNVSTATAEVLVDYQPPRIEAVAFSNPYFSPNSDGKKDGTEVSFSLYDTYADKIIVTASIIDDSGNPVAELVDGQELGPGRHCFTWEASYPLPLGEGASASELAGEGKGYFPDGAYRLEIIAEDTAGNIGSCELVTVVVDTVPPQIIDLAAEPNPFTPNNDGIKDRTDFSYVFSEPCNAELRILRDDGTTLFRDHRHYDIENGGYTWDGSGFHGEVLGEEHPYYLYAEDRAGNVATSETQLIVVDHMPSLVPYAYADPDPFSPVNPDNSFTDIKYYLSRDGLAVTAEVIGREGRVVKSLLNGEVQGRGEHSIRWHGDFASSYDGPRLGDKIADGSWEFRISATDPDGSVPCDTTNTVLVDNIPPHIMVAPVEVDRVAKTATLKYSVPENVSVEVAVLDNEDSLISMMESSANKSAGDYSLIYDFSGEPEGTAANRYFRLVAVDRARNVAEKITEAFAVNPDALQITGHQVVPSTFTPNGDGLTDLTRIMYSVSGGVPEYNVNIDVETQTGSTIKDLVENDPQAPGTYSFYWDGKTNSGQFAPDGYYDYVVTVQDKLGAGVEGRGTMLVVATRPTIDLTTYPPVFSPNGDGLKDTVMINYSIDYALAYITGEALVELQVLNASGEAVWNKIFSHTPGTYAYEYNGEVNAGGKLPAGNYYVKALAQDALGSTAVPSTVDLAVDYTEPEPTDFAIEPAYAKLGTDVRITLEFEEELADDPTVSLLLSGGTIRSAALISSAGNQYEYSYVIAAEDAEGQVLVTAEAQDLAFNPIVRTKAFVIDLTDPQVSGLSISPDPASIPSVSGQVTIGFNVNEPLKAVPKVYVTQNGAAPRSAIVSGSWPTGGLCVAKYDVSAGHDGPAVITVEAKDLANNLTTYQPNDLLDVDTVTPAFSAFQAQIASNPEHSDYAKEGSEVTICFQTSEDLQLNPQVKVNDNPADYHGLVGDEYTYKYLVSYSDTNGNAVVSVSGFDLAGNEGRAEASSTLESFVIDLVRPEVIISEDPGMIANPSPFSTNGSAEVDHTQTTLYYEISENGYVTVSIHKIDNDKTSYTAADFNSSNQVFVFDKGWRSTGQYHEFWNGDITHNRSAFDLNGNSYADPGKYAFIVEVRDWAGNLVEGKWGGTCWIQDNVLDLVNPEQAGKDNPHPLYFSPNGDGSLDSTEICFRVDLGVTPAECATPEKISAFAPDLAWLDGVIKKIGTYTIRVYDESKTTLIRTIVQDKELTSNKILSEPWDGKDDGGVYVAEGTYKIEIDARDYLGGQAMHNLLTLTATVDVTAPRIENHEPDLANTPWTNTWESYDVDLFDDHNAYASKLKHAQYRVMTGPDQTGDEKIGWTDVFGDGLGASSYVTDWGAGIFTHPQISDGIYYVSLKVIDIAGNENIVNDVFYVKKDTTAPHDCWLKINGTDIYTASTGVTLTMGAIDDTSGAEKVVIKNDDGSWSEEKDIAAQAWILNGTEGQRYVHSKFRDKAGNWSNPVNDYVTYRTVPNISSLTVSSTSFNPYSASGSVSISFNASDSPAGLKVVVARMKTGATIVKEWDLGVGGNYSFSWNGQNDAGDFVNEGVYTLEIYVEDNAGFTNIDNSKTITLWDDVNISNNMASSNNPYLEISGGNLNLGWIEGQQIESASANAIDYSVVWTGGISVANADWGEWVPLDIDYAQNVFFSTSGKMQKWQVDAIEYTDASKTLVLAAGAHQMRVLAYIPAISVADEIATLTASYNNLTYNERTRASSNLGMTWGGIVGPVTVESYSSGPTSVGVHSVKAENDQIWYKRNSSAWKQIAKTPSNKANPSLRIDASGNAYVAWEDNRTGFWDIYFQKVPSNFAPIYGTATAASAIPSAKRPAVTQSGTFEPPTLVAPAADADVASLRPTFTWKHHKLDAREYKIDLAKNDTFTISSQTFDKSANTGSPDKDDPTLYHYTYSIHEFDPGLDCDTYYWRVTAVATSEAATSEVRSFTVAPELTLTGITNYPNPFNPNRQVTRIRYRLGATADAVKIRIYDVVGSLVKEIDNCPTEGELSSVWDKYHDVDWDGRNGRGDVVVNGIYPFEVTARLGDKTVSGRGKVAVLK